MNINKMSEPVKFVILAATIVVVCILCAVGFKMANSGKSAVASGTQKYNEMASNQDSTELAVYDNSTVLGNELVNVIKKAIDSNEYLAVLVRTNTSDVSYNYAYDEANQSINKDGGVLTVPVRPEDDGYINPAAMFHCTAQKNADDVIICLEFKIMN